MLSLTIDNKYIVMREQVDGPPIYQVAKCLNTEVLPGYVEFLSNTGTKFYAQTYNIVCNVSEFRKSNFLTINRFLEANYPQFIY